MILLPWRRISFESDFFTVCEREYMNIPPRPPIIRSRNAPAKHRLNSGRNWKLIDISAGGGGVQELVSSELHALITASYLIVHETN
jgi:hypothetical protein